VNAVRIKICGVTRLEDAQAAARLGCDAIGFNFWPESKRYLPPAAARAIIQRLPPLLTTVGVFVNQPEDELRAIAAESGIQVFQLHGDEPPDLCARLPLPVVKSIPVDQVRTLSRLLSYEVSAFLLDTPSRGYGGTGQPFDWSLAHGVSEVAPVILAGGLNPDNVAEAIRTVRPYAVDVASGVERSPGVKDLALMTRFVAAARKAAPA
jgi:phosphoribosylanthranilate isomerase